MSDLVTLDGVSVRYGNRAALADITLALPRGARLAVIGESGSGKSTLAYCITGLLPAGAIRGGRVGFAVPLRLGADIGVLFQDPTSSLNPVLPIGEQIAEVLVVHRGATWSAAKAEAIRLLDRMRIPDAANRIGHYAHQFSGGQCQRIALAAAIAAGPALLIADEPTSALDSVVQAELVRLLDTLVREDGLTLLFITHDIALAAQLADRVAVLNDGHLIEQGVLSNVLANPAHPYTRALIATTLDIAGPPRRRLPEIDPVDFAVLHRDD